MWNNSIVVVLDFYYGIVMDDFEWFGYDFEFVFGDDGFSF